MNTTAVIIARFQTPYLHEGHKYLIEDIYSRHNKVIIVLGIAPVKGSKRNPFDFYTREKLLKQYSPGLIVLPLKDFASDIVWSQQLDELLRNSFPNEEFVLYGSRDSFISHYQGMLKVAELPEHGDHSASSIRTANSDKVLDTIDFRMGINYAYHNMYSRLYPTVDIALLKENQTMVLLGRKPHSNKWRFPGGFADTTDHNYEAAAKRELQEECGPVETDEMQYIGSVRVDDWRYRNETDKIMTIFFKTNLLYGNPQAADDLESLQWFRISELEDLKANDNLTVEHHPLFDLLLHNIMSKK